MVSIRRSKRLRLRAESSVLAPVPRFCDKGTAPQNSTQTKPDSVQSIPSNDANLPEYNDDGLRQNLSHHALAACLHFAMWLRENGESSLASREAMKPELMLQSWRKDLDMLRRF